MTLGHGNTDGYGVPHEMLQRGSLTGVPGSAAPAVSATALLWLCCGIFSTSFTSYFLLELLHFADFPGVILSATAAEA